MKFFLVVTLLFVTSSHPLAPYAAREEAREMVLWKLAPSVLAPGQGWCSEYFLVMEDGSPDHKKPLFFFIGRPDHMAWMGIPPQLLRVVLDETKESPVVEIFDLNRGPVVPIVLRMSRVDYENAASCLPPPGEGQAHVRFELIT